MTKPRHRWDDALSRMEPLAFERLVAEYFRRQGYRVDHVGTGGSRRRYDGGIDLKIRRGAEYLVVQCKRHTHSLVTHNPMHELIGVMRTANATGAILVNSGEFSDYARKMAAQEPRLRLIDGLELRALLGDLLHSESASLLATPLPAATNRKPRQSVVRGTTSESAGPDALIKIALLFSLFLGLRFCATEKPVPTLQLRESNAPRAVEKPPGPAIDRTPQPAPLRQQPMQPSDHRRPYQTPDEAIKVLEESTPEV